ncbi:MAG: hypothetical protein K2M12_03540, partial [Muribaculaceae bacterium]|nr:hypothetical protein [Muribaculaceae bacterium]
MLRKGSDAAAEMLYDGARFVFVGFSNPSVMEQKIFSLLKERRVADFFWDVSSPYISDDKGGVRDDNASFRILEGLMKRFPMPSDFKLRHEPKMPHVEVCGVPSNTGQA